MTDLDPKLTFDSFVVGPANRLAAAAARRAAESPGASYNPLFVYSASGLGKSHILNAIAHAVLKNSPELTVQYMALEGYLEELTAALEAGRRDDFRDRYANFDLLLLDDVQFLAGQPQAQEMLLRTLDHLAASGGQVVLASDRPPADINGLDARLLSRFSGGLIVDIGPPEFETRVAIIRTKAKERGQELAAGVAEAVARIPFKNVRELGGALNKIFAVQDLEERKVTPDELSQILGDLKGLAGQGEPQEDEFGSFLEDIVETVAETVAAQEEEWRKEFREAVDRAEREGYSAARLVAYQAGEEPDDWQGILDSFRADVERLRAIEAELDRMGNPWPEAAEGLLKDPDRLEEAETLLTSVQERQRPFPEIGPGPDLEALEGFPPIAVKAAAKLVSAEKPEYNPLYVWSADAGRGKALLGAAGRSYRAVHAEGRMAVTSVEDFAQDFIRALGSGVAGAWRERWWTVDFLLVHGLEALADTERAQDEFFHLFEALKRRGARVLLAADRAPADIANIDERLRSRFEGGLVLEIEAGQGAEALELVEGSVPEAAPGPEIPPLEDIQVGDRAGLFVSGGAPPQPPPAAPAAPAAGKEGAAPAAPAAGSESVAQSAGGVGPAPGEKAAVGTAGAGAASRGWFPSPESVVIYWPRLEDLLQEELD
ncbi:MAG: DnaA ATPase domain-containing protein [Gemmatimonadota bacterium]